MDRNLEAKLLNIHWKSSYRNRSDKCLINRAFCSSSNDPLLTILNLEKISPNGVDQLEYRCQIQVHHSARILVEDTQKYQSFNKIKEQISQIKAVSIYSVIQDFDPMNPLAILTKLIKLSIEHTVVFERISQNSDGIYEILLLVDNPSHGNRKVCRFKCKAASFNGARQLCSFEALRLLHTKLYTSLVVSFNRIKSSSNASKSPERKLPVKNQAAFAINRIQPKSSNELLKNHLAKTDKPVNDQQSVWSSIKMNLPIVVSDTNSIKNDLSKSSDNKVPVFVKSNSEVPSRLQSKPDQVQVELDNLIVLERKLNRSEPNMKIEIEANDKRESQSPPENLMTSIISTKHSAKLDALTHLHRSRNRTYDKELSQDQINLIIDFFLAMKKIDLKDFIVGFSYDDALLTAPTPFLIELNFFHTHLKPESVMTNAKGTVINCCSKAYDGKWNFKVINEGDRSKYFLLQKTQTSDERVGKLEVNISTGKLLPSSEFFEIITFVSAIAVRNSKFLCLLTDFFQGNSPEQFNKSYIQIYEEEFKLVTINDLSQFPEFERYLNVNSISLQAFELTYMNFLNHPSLVTYVLKPNENHRSILNLLSQQVSKNSVKFSAEEENNIKTFTVEITSQELTRYILFGKFSILAKGLKSALEAWISRLILYLIFPDFRLLLEKEIETSMNLLSIPRSLNNSQFSVSVEISHPDLIRIIELDMQRIQKMKVTYRNCKANNIELSITNIVSKTFQFTIPIEAELIGPGVHKVSGKTSEVTLMIAEVRSTSKKIARKVFDSIIEQLLDRDD